MCAHEHTDTPAQAHTHTIHNTHVCVSTHKQAHMLTDEQNECNEGKKVAKEDGICNQELWYCF